MRAITEIPPQSSRIERVALDRFAFDLQKIVPDSFMRDINIEIAVDTASHDKALQLRAYLWDKDSVEVLPDEIEGVADRAIRYKIVPATWWDDAKSCFKRRFPKVGKRLRVAFREIPTSFRTVIVKRVTNHRHMCPHLDIDAQGKEHYMFCLYPQSHV